MTSTFVATFVFKWIFERFCNWKVVSTIMKSVFFVFSLIVFKNDSSFSFVISDLLFTHRLVKCIVHNITKLWFMWVFLQLIMPLEILHWFCETITEVHILHQNPKGRVWGTLHRNLCANNGLLHLIYKLILAFKVISIQYLARSVLHSMYVTV